MRSTASFTDGRIHVTLCDGPFDLRFLGSPERAVWRRWVEAWRAAEDVAAFEQAVPPAEAAASPELEAIWEDLRGRLALEVLRDAEGEIVELLPWRPEEARAWLRTPSAA